VGVVEPPEFGALVFWVPAMVGGAERKDALFGAGFFLVAAGSPEGHVEAMEIKRLFQAFGFPHVSVQRAVIKGVDPKLLSFRVLVDDEVHAGLLRGSVAQGIHVAELPCSIDMHQREGWRRGVEGLLCQLQHYGAVLADAVKHYRSLGLGHYFAEDMKAFCLETLKMG